MHKLDYSPNNQSQYWAINILHGKHNMVLKRTVKYLRYIKFTCIIKKNVRNTRGSSLGQPLLGLIKTTKYNIRARWRYFITCGSNDTL